MAAGSSCKEALPMPIDNEMTSTSSMICLVYCIKNIWLVAICTLSDAQCLVIKKGKRN